MSTPQQPPNGTGGGGGTGAPPTGFPPGLPPPGAAAGPPPPGALGPCNFGENLGPAADTVSWILIVFTTVFLGLRIYCKWTKSTRLWWDDWVLILSWVLFVTAGIIFSVNVRHGFGIHVCELAVTRPQEVSTVALLSLVAGAIAILASIWSKTSFALTLLRLTEYRWLKITLWILVAILNVSMGISAILTIVQCSPVQKGWDIFVEGYCWREAYTAYSVASAIYSGLTDVALALLPWTIIWNLQMKLTEKIGVAVAMSAGVIAGAASFVKASHIPELAKGDFSYDGYPLVVWSVAEVALTIMAACIPVLRVLLRDVRNASKRYYGRSKDSGSGAQNSSASTPWSIGKSEIGSRAGTVFSDTQQKQQQQQHQQHVQQAQGQGQGQEQEQEQEQNKDQQKHQQQQPQQPQSRLQNYSKHPIYDQEREQHELRSLSYLRPPYLSVTGSAGAEDTEAPVSDSSSQRNILHSDCETAAPDDDDDGSIFMPHEVQAAQQLRRPFSQPCSPWTPQIRESETMQGKMGSGPGGTAFNRPSPA